MEQCLADAEMELDAVDYINAHGTGTKANDEAEAQAVADVFAPCRTKPPISSTKSMLGHSLGASSAIEFLVCIEAIRHAFIPPTLNCDEPDPDLGLDYVPHRGRPCNVRCAMSNSFAFGGNNVALLLETAT
jgi:3-oxoacyl-(acyl-carrier-protein) synthase